MGSEPKDTQERRWGCISRSLGELQSPYLCSVLCDEEELSEGSVHGEKDARLQSIIKQVVFHVGKELPQGP